MTRDGCGCQPWVVKCAHFGGVVLGLSDHDIDKCSCSYLFSPSAHVKYTVVRSDVGEPCPKDSRFRHSAVSDREYSGNDYQAALAAFAKAEIELIEEGRCRT